MLTYGDGLSDVPIDELLRFHKAESRLATVTAVSPEPRFGALEISGSAVNRFREKPSDPGQRINGGFFVFEPEVLSLLTSDECVLEAEPLAALASSSQLSAFEHDGFWMPMDTLRDRDELNRLWATGSPPWVVL